MLKDLALQGLFTLGAPALLRRMPARGARLVVLAYHSVTDDPAYALPGIRVTPALFARQVAYLARNYAVVDLAEAVEMQRAGRPLPDRAVAITFDDGYADNHTHAFPVLRAHGAPATVFATVAPCLDGARFWVSWLYEALRAHVDTDAIERVFGIRVPPEVEPAFNALSGILNYKSARDRAALLDAYAEAARVPRAPRRMLTVDQMREMQRGGIRFGSHTLTHPILANIDAAERRAELQTSRERLSSALDQDVTLIAYPNGRAIPRNFDAAVMADCKAAGYDAAVTSQRRPVMASDDLHALPRMGVAQQGGLARFAITLERFRIRKPAPEPAMAPA